MNGSSSEHFPAEQLRCPHCGVNGCRPELLAALEQFRAAVAAPVAVDSAYRCPVHNSVVGGVPDSQHVRGLAADIRVPGKTSAELEAAARTCPLITGIGRGSTFLHIDVRALHPGEATVMWCYSDTGKWVHYFPPPSPTTAV